MNQSTKHNPGDIFLLFYNLPYSFDKELPIQLNYGLYLENTPDDILEKNKKKAFYVLPNYGLSSTGFNHSCLKFSNPEKEKSIHAPITFFFIFMNSLRLFKPLWIGIAGSFQLDNRPNRINNLQLFHMCSNYQPEQLKNERYYFKDIADAIKIQNRIIEINSLQFKRVSSALIYFSQVTIGMTQSFQLAYLGLFAALEALFAPTNINEKGKILGKRISTFLSNLKCTFDLEQWLHEQYSKRRNKLAHGIQEVGIGPGLNPDKKNDFSKLHEIARLCILGIISFEDEELSEFENLKNKRLEKYLDDLPAAKGKFINKQNFYL